MEITEIRKPGRKLARARALLLFSGGLDSVLAGKLLEEQGIEVVGLTFRSQFFGAEAAVRAAEELGWPLLVVDLSQEQIELVENPKYGYGRRLNPCIDCHGQMARVAGRLLGKYQADFVATGEVLGERPMSQNRQSLVIVEKLSGLKGLVLRPLSARLLEPTIPEEKGLVDRERLLDICGRSRKRQLELAEKYGLKEYPTPAGGCLLTDPVFSARLRRLMEWRGKLRAEDIDLIKTGRVFFESEGLIVVGRDERENEKIAGLVGQSDILVTPAGIKGPLAVVRLKRAIELIDKDRAGNAAHPVERKDMASVTGIKSPASPGEEVEKSGPQTRGRGNVRKLELLQLVRSIQEGKMVPEKTGKGDKLAGVAAALAVREACLLVIRYSQARKLERAEAAVIGWGGSFRLEFDRGEWQKYL
ncbi:MAG: tRNA 4-thiouridine(8) synthase ThiI [Candidatus Saccharicenans sp.]|jgi:tRNA U34 2-thiouridine synthase MnmA/TrmU|nr:tRNA 4-thiouridine(8) synthase ThiI [Candidatus Saccharicenans sp.]MDH7493524.1 tRNA 4-thiouridine(8) synthase ThiI [Candidatus Saccharicenans sp.]